jgi:hypothetical protein
MRSDPQTLIRDIVCFFRECVERAELVPAKKSAGAGLTDDDDRGRRRPKRQQPVNVGTEKIKVYPGQM